MLEPKLSGFGGFKPIHFIIPVLLGIAAVAWMFADEFANFSLSAIPFTTRTAVCLIVVIAMVVLREFGMTWRYRAITDSGNSTMSSSSLTRLRRLFLSPILWMRNGSSMER